MKKKTSVVQYKRKRTVAGGSFPKFSINALCIICGSPSKNLPHPATNSVSPKEIQDVHVPVTDPGFLVRGKGGADLQHGCFSAKTKESGPLDPPVCTFEKGI